MSTVDEAYCAIECPACDHPIESHSDIEERACLDCFKEAHWDVELDEYDCLAESCPLSPSEIARRLVTDPPNDLEKEAAARALYELGMTDGPFMGSAAMDAAEVILKAVKAVWR